MKATPIAQPDGIAGRSFEPNCPLDRAVLVFAGLMILLSVALTHWLSAWWLLFTVFIGLNLIQSAFTGFCPAAIVLSRLGFGSGCAFRTGVR